MVNVPFSLASRFGDAADCTSALRFEECVKLLTRQAVLPLPLPVEHCLSSQRIAGIPVPLDLVVAVLAGSVQVAMLVLGEAPLWALLLAAITYFHMYIVSRQMPV